MSNSETAPLIRYLQKLASDEDRGALAALRRGLGKPPGTVMTTYPFVVPFLPAQDGPQRTWPEFVIASLFALHPCSCSGVGFGRTFQRLAESPSREARFRAVLNASAAEVPYHLRQAVGQLAAKDIPIDWNQLLWDLRGWNKPERPVQLRWARDYWAPYEADKLDHQGE